MQSPFPSSSPPFASPLLFSSCLIRQQREYHCQGLGFRCLVLCVEPELSPCVHLEKHTNSTKNTPIVLQKKQLNMPFPAFPPSLRLKEPQTKLTSLIPPERLQEISWQDFWRSHAPRGASSVQRIDLSVRPSVWCVCV